MRVWVTVANGLTPKQLSFVAAYIGVARGNATEAARIAGYASPNVEGSRLLVNASIRDQITEYRKRIEDEGIANQQNRVDAYNARWKLLEEIRRARSEDDWLANIPGGHTGFVVKQLKSVKHQYDPDPDDADSKGSLHHVEMWESAVDTGLLNEFRQLEKQAAQDIGQWTEKKEIAGPHGDPLSFTFALEVVTK